MNHFKVLFGVLLVALMMTLPASATTISFQSGDGVGEEVLVPPAVVPQSTVLITPHPAWGTMPAGDWVSFDQTGYQGIVVANTNNVNNPTAIFYEEFYLPYGDNSGSATFGADDTMAVYIMNSLFPVWQLLKAANWVQDGACADGPIACEQAEFETINLTPYLAQGTNTIAMFTYQRGSGPFGAVWEGTVESVPEPTTFALMGLGLLALGAFHRRRTNQ